MSQVFEWREAPEAEFAVIGDPIGHSLSPIMHQAWLDSVGIDKRYVAIRVWVEELAEALEHLTNLSYIGLNATLPIKERLIDVLPNIDGFAKRVGAINTVDLRTQWGANTDAPGFLATLDEYEFEPGTQAVLLGAGGSARAIAAALTSVGFELRIWNRTSERAQKLIVELGINAEVIEEPEIIGAQLVVNATTGVSDVEMPIDWSAAESGALAYDLMYGRSTPFLNAARIAGLRVQDGLKMLVEQGALSMEMWTGESVDRSVMLQAVENAV